MGIKIDFDDYTISFFAQMMTAETIWQSYMQDFAHTIGIDAKEHMKPFTTAKSKWKGATHGTGAMADSIHEDVIMLGGRFAVTFDGNFYGNYLDVGNFPASSEIARTSGKPFPVGARPGQAKKDITFTRYIHGVGNWDPQDWPAHFSEKTANWLVSDKLQEYCDEFMGGFLRELVKV